MRGERVEKNVSSGFAFFLFSFEVDCTGEMQARVLLASLDTHAKRKKKKAIASGRGGVGGIGEAINQAYKKKPIYFFSLSIVRFAPFLTVTLYPLSASRIAVAAPMPAPPPVTRALGIFLRSGLGERATPTLKFFFFFLLALFLCREREKKMLSTFFFFFSVGFLRKGPGLKLSQRSRLLLDITSLSFSLRDVVRRPRRGPRPPPGRRARRGAKQPRGLPDGLSLVCALAAADRCSGHGGCPRCRPRQARHAQAGLFPLREQTRLDACLCRRDAEG